MLFYTVMWTKAIQEIWKDIVEDGKDIELSNENSCQEFIASARGVRGLSQILEK